MFALFQYHLPQYDLLAYQAESESAGGSAWQVLLVYAVVIGALFYFLMIWSVASMLVTRSPRSAASMERSNTWTMIRRSFRSREVAAFGSPNRLWLERSAGSASCRVDLRSSRWH